MSFIDIGLDEIEAVLEGLGKFRLKPENALGRLCHAASRQAARCRLPRANRDARLGIMLRPPRWRPEGEWSGYSRPALGELGADRLDQIETLPGKAAVIVRLPSEMAVSRGALIDRAPKAEMLPDAARAQIHDPPQRLLEL